MSRWRIAIILLLLAVPLLVWMTLGSVYLWQRHLGFYVWWPMAACMALGYYLAWHWLRKKQLLRPPDADVPMYWTERDHEAWKLVEQRARAVAALQMVELNEIQFYATLAQEMALELAKYYHPKASDPYSSLTVPEILAVVELASHDLAEMVDQSVPGGHLMTIDNWRWAKQAATQASSWYRTASNVYWLVSAVFSPVETGLRFAASQLGMSRPWQMFQQDLIAWFHTAFVHRLGKYLIELNSGRLRVGAQKYRELTRPVGGNGAAAPVAIPVPEQAAQVTLTILGQVKMGKSSLVNALLGEQRAKTDVLPATADVTRYQLQLPDSSARLLLLDTVGYAHTGPKEDQLRATQEAAQQSDLLILVLHARNPARQADEEMLQGLRRWHESRPHLKLPPVLAVVTHIDLLSPAMEWAPPYNWEEPSRPKEVQIAEALHAVHDQLGSYLVGVVPVCTADGKAYGIDEWLLPALSELLGEARAVALVRCLRAEADAHKVRKVVEQLLNVGEQALRIWARRAARR